jgi:hypothetical protein
MNLLFGNKTVRKRAIHYELHEKKVESWVLYILIFNNSMREIL